MMPILFGPIANRYKDRQGGYTRLTRLGRRTNNSDRAETCLVSLVDSKHDINSILKKYTQDLQNQQQQQKKTLKEETNQKIPRSQL